MSKRDILERLNKAVIDGDVDAVKMAMKDAIEAKIDPTEAVNEGMTKGMALVGEKFHKLEIFLPEILLAADAMKAGLNILNEVIEPEKMAKLIRGKVVIGTAKGDIHDIGKDIVVSMLSAARYEVHDLGCDVDPLKFLEKAKEVNADFIGISCLLSPSLWYQRDVIKLLKDMGIRDKYYVIVGGGTVSSGWAEEIAADGYGRLADNAVELANILMERGSEVKRPVIQE